MTISEEILEAEEVFEEEVIIEETSAFDLLISLEHLKRYFF